MVCLLNFVLRHNNIRIEHLCQDIKMFHSKLVKYIKLGFYKKNTLCIFANRMNYFQVEKKKHFKIHVLNFTCSFDDQATEYYSPSEVHPYPYKSDIDSIILTKRWDLFFGNSKKFSVKKFAQCSVPAKIKWGTSIEK